MRRVFAYLTKSRGVDPKIISAFAKKALIYEDAIHHNAVFVGRDRDGTPRHAHSRSTQSVGKTFRINEAGSRPQYSFHWLGQSDTLYVFEAPIDLLSYLSLHPEGWEDSSYVALCGLGEKPILWMLEQYPRLRTVKLGLDNDQAGRYAAQRITGILAERGYGDVTACFPARKDWNEDLKAARGLQRAADQEPTMEMGGYLRINALWQPYSRGRRDPHDRSGWADYAKKAGHSTKEWPASRSTRPRRRPGHA